MRPPQIQLFYKSDNSFPIHTSLGLKLVVIELAQNERVDTLGSPGTTDTFHKVAINLWHVSHLSMTSTIEEI